MSELINDSVTQQFDRLPPHSIKAEMSLLASIMLDKSVVPTCRAMIDREAFYQADHQIIWDILLEMYDKKRPVDTLTLREELIRRELFEEVGGAFYLAQILNEVPSAAHAEHYAKIIREKGILRQGISIANEMLRDCYAPHDLDEPPAILSKFATRAIQAAMTGGGSSIKHISDIIPEVLDAHKNGEVRRIPTGLNALDKLVGGLPFGQKIIVGGRPFMGKSALLKVFAHSFASAGWKVGIISIEEQGQKIVTNLLSKESLVLNNRIAFGTASAQEWGAVEDAAGPLSALPIWIEDSSRKLSEIEAAANLLVSKHGCQVIMVDHLHIIEPDESRFDNRERELSKISSRLKWIWKALNVVGVEAAQLNRGNASQENKPSLTSLRDSGSLEQDADIVLLLHREDYYALAKNENHIPDHILEIIVAKNKDGAPGIAPVFYDEGRYSMRDLRLSEKYEGTSR